MKDESPCDAAARGATSLWSRQPCPSHRRQAKHPGPPARARSAGIPPHSLAAPGRVVGGGGRARTRSRIFLRRRKRLDHRGRNRKRAHRNGFRGRLDERGALRWGTRLRRPQRSRERRGRGRSPPHGRHDARSVGEADGRNGGLASGDREDAGWQPRLRPLCHERGRWAKRPRALFAGEQYVASASAVAVGSWSHVAMTYDGSRIDVYVNGSAVASHPASGAVDASTDALQIGGNAASAEWFAERSTRCVSTTARFRRRRSQRTWPSVSAGRAPLPRRTSRRPSSPARPRSRAR